jgi:hypothetical protein
MDFSVHFVVHKISLGSCILEYLLHRTLDVIVNCGWGGPMIPSSPPGLSGRM